MKKFACSHVFVIILATVLLVAFAVVSPRQLPLVLKNANEYQIYCRSTCMPFVDSGVGKIVSVGADVVRRAMFVCRFVDGYTARFDDCDIVQLVKMLAVKVESVQSVGNVVVLCGYTPRLRGGVVFDGKTVNVQIALTDHGVFVGNPLLLGSY